MEGKAPTVKEPYFFSVLWQRFIDWIFFPLLSFILILVMKFYAGYKVKDLSKVRKKYKEICKIRGNRPLLICPNHLTMIDSVVLEWAFGSPLWYWLHFRNFPWNIPAVENFKTNYTSRTITYLGKCIPIDRKGGKEHTEYIMSQVEFLLKRGDAFLIFPEGTRSRSGKFELENITYGVGKLIQNLPGIYVLCVYLRGKGQKTYSNFPAKNEEFYIDMCLIEPKTNLIGMRGQRDLALQVGKEIHRMEMEYFNKGEHL